MNECIEGSYWAFQMILILMLVKPGGSIPKTFWRGVVNRTEILLSRFLERRRFIFQTTFEHEGRRGTAGGVS